VLLLAKRATQPDWELPCAQARDGNERAVLEDLFNREFGLAGLNPVTSILGRRIMEDWRNKKNNVVHAEMQVWMVQLSELAWVNIEAGEPYTQGGEYEDTQWVPLGQVGDVSLRPTHNMFIMEVVDQYYGDSNWQMAIASGN
jgi:hypothetical protein